MEKIFLLLLIKKLAAQAFLDPDYITVVDSVRCNAIFPFVFGTGHAGISIVDWDIQNFNDNYSQFAAYQSSFAVTQSSYVAMCYLDSGDLYCGVTYETERTFKWLR